ncbi:MAG: c-type cytochrome [Actinomycetota bacterium]
MTRGRIAIALIVLATAGTTSACGEQGIELGSNPTAQDKLGAQLFSERCSGCHTLRAAGAEGSATKINDRERTDGPNFNQRKETNLQVLYALANGGYSGAIMPQNIVVGADAKAVAAFVAKYSGSEVDVPASPGAAPSGF